MRMTILRALVVAACVLAAACSRHSEPAESGAQKLERISEAAAAEAQLHFDAALARHERSRNSVDSFLVTVRLPAEGEGPLVLRLDKVERSGSGLAGVIERPSPNYPEFRRGARVTFPENVIADWELTVEGRQIGQFAMRGLLCEAGDAVGAVERLAALGGRRHPAARALEETDLSSAQFEGACEAFDPAVLD